jgi:hypothetical protein
LITIVFSDAIFACRHRTPGDWFGQDVGRSVPPLCDLDPKPDACYYALRYKVIAATVGFPAGKPLLIIIFGPA